MLENLQIIPIVLTCCGLWIGIVVLFALWMFIEIVIFDVNTTIACIRRNIMKGQGLVEYALILVLVAVIAIAILSILGPAIGNMFSVIVSGL